MFVVGQPLDQPHPYNQPSSTEPQRLVCQVVNAYGNYVFCVGHTHPSRAVAQSSEMVYIIVGNYGCCFLQVFGGDLNPGLLT
jgi:hypothetical protein